MITVHLVRFRKWWIACAPAFTAQMWRGRSMTEALGRLIGNLAVDLGIKVHAELDDTRRHVITDPPVSRWVLEEALADVAEGKKRMAKRILKLLPPLYPPAGHTSGDRQ